MKTIIKILIVMVLPLSISAQSLSPTVISSSGGSYASSSVTLSFTTAEMTMVHTFSNATNMLTQGFQQPEDFTVSVPENEATSASLLIFPNPTSGHFSVTTQIDGSTTQTLILYDLLGQHILSRIIEQPTSQYTTEFDISALSQGIYLLEHRTKDSSGKENSEFFKINLLY